MVSGCTTPSTAPAHEVVDRPMEGAGGEFVVGGNSFRDSTTRQTQLKRRSTSVSKFAFTLSEMTRYALLSLAGVRKHPDREERVWKGFTTFREGLRSNPCFFFDNVPEITA